MKIAVIGSGISGLAFSYLSHQKYNIELYEKNDYIGGHARTITLNNNIAVDTGFIVYNHKNYPLLTKLFNHLQVKITKSNMSFGVSVNGGFLEYGTNNLWSLFAQKKNLFHISYWKMLKDILFFFQQAKNFKEKDPSFSLEDCLKNLKLGDWCKNYFILPMGSAIWSSNIDKMMNFPASSFIRFFENHGLLTIKDQPQWYTVIGGSKEYIKKITAFFSSKIIKIPVKKVKRDNNKVSVTDQNGNQRLYDQVVFACNAQESLSLLENPTSKEKSTLSDFKYQKNQIFVHSDIRFMPKTKKAWSSWNYLLDENKKQIVLSYWMNLLQNLNTETPIIITLNPPEKPNQIYDSHTFYHPVFNQKAVQAQSKIMEIQGTEKIWFCGAYQRNGFHEDGIWSAYRVAKEMGIISEW